MAKKKKILIDAGHGGKDGGAASNGLEEANVNLYVATKVAQLLVLNGFEVKMTRTSDKFVELNERADMANEFGADLCVSVHHNAGGGIGYGIIYDDDNSLSIKAAQFIGKEFDILKRPKHNISTRKLPNGEPYYAMIRLPHMAAIITEFGYVDSKDHLSFDTPAEQVAEAVAIAKGISKLFGVRTFRLK